MSAGKGSYPRSCFSREFKSNYDKINWHRAKTIDEVCGNPKGTFKKFVEEQREKLRSENSHNRRNE